MCKFCTHLFSVQLTFIKNSIDVASYYSSVFLKKNGHLGLRQPHRLVLQTDINLGLSVLCLIDDNLILFHIVRDFARKDNLFLSQRVCKPQKYVIHERPFHSISKAMAAHASASASAW